jgi:hypothetical protein
MLLFAVWVVAGTADLTAVVDGRVEARAGAVATTKTADQKTTTEQATSNELYLRAGVATELKDPTWSVRLNYQPQLQLIRREGLQHTTTLTHHQAGLQGRVSLDPITQLDFAGAAFLGQLDALRAIPGSDPATPAALSYSQQILNYAAVGGSAGGQRSLSGRTRLLGGLTASLRGGIRSSSKDLPTETNVGFWLRLDEALSTRARTGGELSVARVDYSGTTTSTVDAVTGQTTTTTTSASRYTSGTATAAWTWTTGRTTELALRGGAFFAYAEQAGQGSVSNPWLKWPVGDVRFEGLLFRARRSDLKGQLRAGVSAYYDPLSASLGPRSTVGGNLQLKAEGGLTAALSGEWLHAFPVQGGVVAKTIDQASNLVVANFSTSWLTLGTTRVELGATAILAPRTTPMLQQFLLTLALSSLADLGV